MSEENEPETVPVAVTDLLRINALLTDLVQFFHQPMNYPTADEVIAYWQKGAYKELSDIHYNLVWGYLPEEEKRRIEES